MKTTEKRAENKEDVRREILTAAKELFAKEGYETFTMLKLAEKTGYSQSTINLHFKDKDGLLFAISEEVAERFFLDLTAIKTTHSDPLESLRQALLYLIAFGFNNPDEYKTLVVTRPHVYGSLEEFMEKESMARNTYFVLKEIVKNCLSTGKLLEIDIDVLTQVFIVATRGAALTVSKTSFPWVDRNVLVHTLAEGLQRGYQR